MDFFDDDGSLGLGGNDYGNDEFNSWLNTQPIPSQPAGPAMSPGAPPPGASVAPSSTSKSPNPANMPPQVGASGPLMGDQSAQPHMGQVPPGQGPQMQMPRNQGMHGQIPAEHLHGQNMGNINYPPHLMSPTSHQQMPQKGPQQPRMPLSNPNQQPARANSRYLPRSGTPASRPLGGNAGAVVMSPTIASNTVSPTMAGRMNKSPTGPVSSQMSSRIPPTRMMNQGANQFSPQGPRTLSSMGQRPQGGPPHQAGQVGPPAGQHIGPNGPQMGQQMGAQGSHAGSLGGPQMNASQMSASQISTSQISASQISASQMGHQMGPQGGPHLGPKAMGSQGTSRPMSPQLGAQNPPQGNPQLMRPQALNQQQNFTRMRQQQLMSPYQSSEMSQRSISQRSGPAQGQMTPRPQGSNASTGQGPLNTPQGAIGRMPSSASGQQMLRRDFQAQNQPAPAAQQQMQRQMQLQMQQQQFMQRKQAINNADPAMSPQSGPAAVSMQAGLTSGPSGPHSGQNLGVPPRSGKLTVLSGLKTPQLSPSDLRVALGALSLYTQLLKFGTHSFNVKDIVRRIDSIAPPDQRKMVEDFEISRLEQPHETAKLPVMQLIPQIFWRTVGEVYSHIRRSPIPEFIVVSGQRLPLMPFFQSVQVAGGFVGASLSGRWSYVMKMLSVSTGIGNISELDLVAIYANTLLTFEVYADENEHIRRSLTQKLNPQRSMHRTLPSESERNDVGAMARGPGDHDSNAHPSHSQMTAPQLSANLPPNAHMQNSHMVSPQVANGLGDMNERLHPGTAGAMGRGSLAYQEMNDKSMGPMGNTAGKRPVGGIAELGKKRPKRDSNGAETFMMFVENGRYLLQRRHFSTHGGRNIRYLTTLGNEVENWRPEVAFPLDLGTVDLHAVTCSLASRDPAEVRQALDKLAVVSANPKVHESLQHCPRLFANLCNLILGMLHQLMLPDTHGDGRQYTLKGLKTWHLESSDDYVKLAAKTSVGLVHTQNVLERLRDPVKDQCGEIEIEIDPLTGEETGKRIERPIRGSKAESFIVTEESHISESFEAEIPVLDAQTMGAVGAKEVVQGDSQTSVKNETESEEPTMWSNPIEEFVPSPDKPFYFPCYGSRYQTIESELCTLGEVVNEKRSFLLTSLLDRLLLATCVLRNLSFSVANRPVIAHKPEFQRLFWQWLDICGECPNILDSELRKLDLCKDFLTVLGNIGLYLRLPSARDTLKLMLFLLSFSPVESPYTENGELKLMDYDIDVHQYLPNAIDVFVKVASREQPNRKQVEEVLLGTSTDEGYKVLFKRWLKAQNRESAYPAELLTRMFALAVSMIPLTHFRPPSRGIETRQPYLLQGSLAAELLVNMIPDEENNEGEEKGSAAASPASPSNHPQLDINIATTWLNSLESFGARMVRTLNFMGMVVLNQEDGEPQRPFAKITQRAIGIVQRLFKKAKRDPNFQPTGIVPSIEHLLGGLMASKMDKVIVKHLNALYDESFTLQDNLVPHNAEESS